MKSNTANVEINSEEYAKDMAELREFRRFAGGDPDKLKTDLDELVLRYQTVIHKLQKQLEDIRGNRPRRPPQKITIH